MDKEINSVVTIVGAGPVGLTLAIDLAQRGIQVTVIETRYRGEPPNVKCNHVSARSMEIFRRLGLAKSLRDAGLPADYPNDISYRTSFTGNEISRIPIPCRKDRYTAEGGPDTWWPTPEPPHRINQIFLEPIIFEFAAAQKNIQIINRAQVIDCGQDDDGVTSYAKHLDTDEPFTIRSEFLIGCDGGRSSIRKIIGAALSGTDVVSRVQSTYIKAPSLIKLQQFERAWATFSINPRRTGNVYAIDGKENWLVHNYLKDDEADFESIDRDWAIRQILGVDEKFEYEVLSKEDWFGRRLVADRFRDRRMFICGDAAHLWVPMAGYGMNAGIADAMNLSWTLAAYINGWAGPAILNTYQVERQPITEQVSNFAMNHEYALAKERKKASPLLEENTPEGQAARNELGQSLYDLNVKQYCCGGLNFGYFYDKSNIISYDGQAQPTYTINTFTSSTVPGCRLPHIWLENKESLYDKLGNDLALIQFGDEASGQELVNAAKEMNIPLKLIQLGNNYKDDVYKENLILVRPDLHIAWRGNTSPVDCSALLKLVTGW